MKIFIKNLQKKLPIRGVKIKTLILRLLKAEGVKESGEINIFFVNDERIKKLNLKFLKINHSTDVLAFNLSQRKLNKILLADIIISTYTAISNARKFKTTPEYELRLYVIHGLLHILGYDDRNQDKRKLMRKKEQLYVNR